MAQRTGLIEGGFIIEPLRPTDLLYPSAQKSADTECWKSVSQASADRSNDRAGPPVALSALVGALCQSTVGAGEPDAARVRVGGRVAPAGCAKYEALPFGQPASLLRP